MRLVAFALVWSVTATLGGRNPVAKVTELLSTLKAQVETDARDEGKLYDTFSCWCQDTMVQKKSDIATATKRIGDLTDSVGEFQGKTASSGSQVAKLTKDLAAAKESHAAATTVRTKEAEDFIVRKGQLETGITNLGSAIATIGEATGDQSSMGGTIASSELLETKWLSVANGVRASLRLLGKNSVDSAKATKVKTFLSNPAAWVQEGQKGFHGGDYAPGSGPIMGILKEMHDQFNRDLVSETEVDGKAASDFAALTATKTKNEEMLAASLTKATLENGEASQQLAADQLERRETQKQLAEDTAFLETTTQNCQKRAEEWNTRSQLRMEEGFGMQKAIDILSEGAGTFTNASSFVQLSVRSDPRQSEAYKELAQLAEKQPRLAAIAASAQVAEASGGHFDRIIATVDRMLKDLAREKADDEEHKDWCNHERDNANKKESALEFDSTDQGAKIARADSKKEELQDALTANGVSKTEMEATLASMLDQRRADSNSSTQAKKDDMESVQLLNNAIKELSAFSQKHAFLQISSSEDPPPVWGGSEYKGKSASGGILAILGTLRDDFEKQLHEGDDEEAFSLKSYEKQRRECEGELATLAREKQSLDGELATTMRIIGTTTRLQGDTEAGRAANQAYLIQLKPNCDWVELTYDSRKSARAEQVTGLQNAKSILSGAEMPEADLVSTSSVVAKSKPMSVADELNALNSADRKSFLRR